MHEEIGVALKSARRAKGLSLRQLADQLSISTSLLSQVENGKTQPSVKTLFGLATALDVSLDDLVNGVAPEGRVTVEPPGGRDALAGIQRRADNPILEMENGVTWERLASAGRTNIETLYVTYNAHASSSVDGRMMRHSGVEFAYILEGTLHLQLDFDEYVLRPGDSFCFNSSRPHLFSNPDSVPVKGLWFIFDDESVSGDIQTLLGALRTGTLTNGTKDPRLLSGPGTGHFLR